jgi:peptide deformylase
MRLPGALDGRLREIVRMGHPMLRERAAEVAGDRLGTRFLRDLGRDLIRTMHDGSGVGLAAPQIALPLRLFAYYVPAEGATPALPPRVLVNPRLTLHGQADEAGWEGCLSIPGLRGLVPRHARVRVEAVDVDGEPLAFEADGFQARVIQHEFDHLDGILFLDRMPTMVDLYYEEEWDRFADRKELPVEV